MPDPTPPAGGNQILGQLPASVPDVGVFLGAVAMAAVQADSMAKDAAANRLRSFATPDKNGDIPMLTFGAGVTIPKELSGGASDLMLGATFKVPELIIEPDRILAPTKVTASWHLNIHSTATDDSDIEAHESGSGEASIGWGPFKATVKIEASASESEVKKRTTDDTATLEATMEMSQIPVSEGQSMIMSSLRQIVRRGVEVVDKLAQKEAQQLARQAGVGVPAADGTVIPPDSKGGGGGGGGG